jgi:two-component system sensor histidine kinase/response regulator
MPEPAPRILIVDDEASHMKALCDTLREGGGYETAGFTDAYAALAAMQETPFDLLLSDLMMPGMDGITLLREARKADPSLPGIIMTGQGTIATAVEAMKTGAFDYILKPFKLSLILPVLARALAMRKLQLENIALQEELRRRAAELEATNKELEAFSYSVSHDLRAPLRAVDGYARMLEEDCAASLGDEGRRLLAVVRTQAVRMGELIDDLLAFSRTGRQRLQAAPVDMEALARDAAAELSGAYPAASIEFLGLPQASCDRALLKQVWLNLVGNALKYSGKRPSPRIEIGGRMSGTEAEYWVSDNGTGFDPRHADRLFGVFQRLHSPDDFPGTGVGLALVQRIVLRHGGRVWAEGKPGEGASFGFALPAKKDQPHAG